MRKVNQRRACTAAVTAMAIGLVSASAWGATDTWIGGGADGKWTTAGNWNGTTGNAPPVANDVLQFDGTTNLTTSNNFATGTQFDGINFLSTAGSFALGGNSVLLGGDINDNSTNAQAVTLGLLLDGATSNVNVVSGGSLTLGAITFGAAPASGNVSTLDINNTVTASTLNVLTNTTLANTINIASGAMLSFSGSGTSFGTIGTVPGANGTNASNNTNAILDVAGAGTLNMTSTTNSSFNIGVGAGNNTPTGRPVATVDMSNLANFVFSTGTGTFSVGNLVTRSSSTLNLANTSNSITAASVVVGDSNQSGGNNNGNGSFLNLGAGTNVINANTINVGFTKSTGGIEFLTNTGSVSIDGETGGSSTANITIGHGSSSTDTTTAAQLLLAGHTATVQAGTVQIGVDAGATGGSPSGIVTFDTGTFGVNVLQLAVHSSGTATATGTFTLGTNGSSTGVLNVNTTFDLADQTAAGTSSGIFNINGGTANINTNIVDASTTGTHTGTINLNGGVLNMMGNSIGTSAAPITLNGAGGTLKNLGGTGVNGAGLVLNSSTSAFNLDGTNTYTGDTNIQAGKLGVISSLPNGATISGGTLTGTGNAGPVILSSGNLTSGALTAAPSGNLTISSLAMSGGNLLFDMSGSGSNTITDSGAASFTGGGLAFALANGAPPTNNQQFTVFTAAGGISNGGLNLAPVSLGRITFTPAISGNNIVVTSTGSAASLTWNNVPGGGDGSTWDIDGQQNWNSTAPTNPYQYFDGDNVTFNDTNNGNYTVNLNTSVTPGSITVSTNGAYKITGGGAIVGATGIVLGGNGSLTLDTSNSYTGTTSVGAGSTLIVTRSASLGAASGAVNIAAGGMLDIGGDSTANDINFLTKQFDIAGNGVGGAGAIINSSSSNLQENAFEFITLTGNASIGGTSRWDMRNTGGSAPVLDLGGFTLTKVGTNQIAFVATTIKNGTGGIVVSSGGLSLETTTTTQGSGSITFAPGTTAQFFQNSGTSITWPLIFQGNNSLGNAGTTNATIPAPITLDGNVTFTALSTGVVASGNNDPLTLNGNITESGGSQSVTFNANTTFTLAGNNNWTGGTLLQQGTLKLGSGTALPTGTALTLSDSNNDSATLDLNSHTATVSALTVAGTGSAQIGNSSITANSTLTYAGNAANPSTFNGNIQDSVNGGTKTVALAVNSGTLILTNGNSYSGGTSINGGTLQMQNGGALGSSNGSLTVSGGTLDLFGNSPTVTGFGGAGGMITNTNTNGATLNANLIGTSSFAGTIADGAGQVSLNLQNNGSTTGILTLSGHSTYSGDTNIRNNNTVILNGSLASNNININDNSTLIVNGSTSATGNVNLNSNTVTLGGTGSLGNVNDGAGNINPGTSPGAVGTLTMSSLNVGGSGVLALDLGSSGNDKIVVNGTANFNGGSSILVSPIGGTTIPVGTYTLLTSTSLQNISGSQPEVASTGSRQALTLDYSTPNTIKIDVGGGTAANLIWNNSNGNPTSGNWDFTDQNWQNNGNPDKFFSLDNVTFNDNNNGNYNVNINAGTIVEPGSITFANNNFDYAISGGGSIGGATGLVMNGTQTVNINTVNTFTGDTVVNSGILTVNGGAAIASANINVAAAGTFVVQGGGTLSTAPNLTNNGMVFFANPAQTLATLNGSISTAVLVLNNGDALTVQNGGTYAGQIQDNGSNGSLVVSAGTLSIGGGSWNGATSVASGAALVINGAITNSSSGNNNFTLGTASGASASATFNANATFNNFTSATDTVASGVSTPNTVTIASGQTLTFTGAVTIGVAPLTTGTANTNIAVNFTGGGSLVIAANSDQNFSLGVGNNSNSGGGNPVAVFDVSGLSSFSFSSHDGTFGVGNIVTRSSSTAILAANSNSIIATSVVIGDTNQSGTGNNSGAGSVLELGPGSNTIDADNINIGLTKTIGTLEFANSNGSVSIAAENGTDGANITIARSSSGTFFLTQNPSTSALLLAGHDATIIASVVDVGVLAGGSSGTPVGNLTFDTGTFTANTITLATDSSGTSAGITGDFTLGSPNSTETLTVAAIMLANVTNSSTVTKTDTANFTIAGGTATVGNDITVSLNSAATGTTINANLNLFGGTLNMNGHAIGSATGPAINVNFPGANQSATLENLGGAGVNGAGLTMNTAGTLTITDTNGNQNNYSGGTTVSAGKLIIGSTTALGQGGLSITNSGIAQLAPSLGSPFQFVMANLSIATGGTLDITNNAVVIHNGDPNAIAADINAGRTTSGNWTGSGITSSDAADTPGTAVGELLNDNGSGNPIYSDWPTIGNSIGVSNTDVLVMYTWYGDLNLDGVVNSTDISLMATGSRNTWSTGDLNGDGVVNADDWSLLQLGAVESAGRNISSVPEPAMMVIFAIPLFALRRRRTAE